MREKIHKNIGRYLPVLTVIIKDEVKESRALSPFAGSVVTQALARMFGTFREIRVKCF